MKAPPSPSLLLSHTMHCKPAVSQYFTCTYTFLSYAITHTVIIVGLSSTSYGVTEGPNAVATVCVTIQLGSVGRDVAVLLFTPVTGSVITGM